MEELAVNELSFISDTASPVDGYDLFTGFFSLCVEYSKLAGKGAISLWSSRSIKRDLLCGITFGQWYAAQDRSSRELRVFALGLTVNQRNIDSYPEYLYGGAPCQGLAAAADLDLLCLSFRSDAAWDTKDVTITRRTLDEAAEPLDEQLSVRHASISDHLGHHRQWMAECTSRIEEKRLREIISAGELWERRTELFPNLAFCAATYSQLEELFLNASRLRHVYSRLRELNRATGRWDRSGPFDHHQFSKATPESESRRQTFDNKLAIECPDGVTRSFTWHVRFTPDAGRLYYHPDQSTGCCYIGYIGLKIL